MYENINVKRHIVTSMAICAHLALSAFSGRVHICVYKHSDHRDGAREKKICMYKTYIGLPTERIYQRISNEIVISLNYICKF